MFRRCHNTSLKHDWRILTALWRTAATASESRQLELELRGDLLPDLSDLDWLRGTPLELFCLTQPDLIGIGTGVSPLERMQFGCPREQASAENQGGYQFVYSPSECFRGATLLRALPPLTMMHLRGQKCWEGNDVL
ncbi:hypothetical protein BLNAU_7666 [Blattamonas nauphoetae]|uniref:Uncharacterized protein n=1 Tax=Blattamonas nauphoetae TaxID=2049346 RepID=A0ABQ9Y0M9_9EUKA|nr:hypothetical protein BLNAU_7666 [Blattamonas nauphoetae]